VTTLEEHRARVEEMKAAEARVRMWSSGGDAYEGLHGAARVEAVWADVRLMLKRIDAYEASIVWHTDCLTCPKLLDENHRYFELLKRVVTDKPDEYASCLANHHSDDFDCAECDKLIDDITEALK
jgi:hypothetical protein